jgi:hypothetical protein
MRQTEYEDSRRPFHRRVFIPTKLIRPVIELGNFDILIQLAFADDRPAGCAIANK